MTDETQHSHEDAGRAPALKTRAAGIMTATVVVSLALVPAAASAAMNHNETVLAID